MNHMNHFNHATLSTKKMKTTAILLAAALLAPLGLALGLSAALISTAATGIALASIALGDYGKTTCSYAATPAKRAERHPLAA